MSEIVFRICVWDHSESTVKDTWWERAVETTFLPGEHDSIQLWGDDDGPLAPVQRRWWRPDGKVCVEPVPIVLNGNNGSSAMKDGRLQWVPLRRKSEDLAVLLQDAGWERL